MSYHYVYRITNTTPNKNQLKYYYGVRSSKCLPLEDIKYMSSCRLLKESIDEMGKELFKKKILRLFETRKEAVTFEIYLHNKFDVGINPLFYNQAKQTSTGFDTTGKGKPQTKEHILKRTKNTKGSGNGMFGKKHTEDAKRIISIANQRPQKIVICPKCNKKGGISLMKKYHFDNCGKKTYKQIKGKITTKS